MNTVKTQFCYWDSQTRLDTYLMVLITFIATFLFYLVIRTYMKARRVLKPGVLKFYYWMILWGISKIVK